MTQTSPVRYKADVSTNTEAKIALGSIQ